MPGGSTLLLAALLAHPGSPLSAPATPIAPGIDQPYIVIADPPERTVPTGTEGLKAGDAIQGRADRDQRMTVDVRIGGKGPYRFLVDTGAQNTVLSSRLAGELGLEPGPQVRVMSMGGIQSVTTTQVDSIEIGPHAFYDLTVPLLEASHLGADGIVGTDSLQDQRVVLDFARNRIGIDPLINAASRRHANAGYEIVVRARARSGRLILTNATIDGVRADVVIDTGASTTVGNAALRKALRAKGSEAVTLTSVTGDDLAAQLGLAGEMRIGKMSVENVAIAFAEAPVFAQLGLAKRPAVFLGMRELRGFKRIAIDFARKKVLFDLPD